MEKLWKIRETPVEKASQLAEQIKIHPVLCNILAQRGIADYETAKAFSDLN